MLELEPIVELTSESGAGFVSGFAKTLESLNRTLVQIARTSIPVLIVGESGTGKDVYVRLLNRLSGSSDAELKKLNCSLLDPRELLRQIHQYSSPVSGSHLPRTLFLDAIDELDLACQRALVSAFPENYGQTSNDANFPRLVSTSCCNLEQFVADGKLRKELYFRINGACLRLPALRERKEDISHLLEYFLKKHAEDFKRPAPAVDPETLELLAAYDWPGNIRQLENLARKMVATGNAQLALNDLRFDRQVRTSLPALPNHASLKIAAKAASKKAERELILQALERTHWNRKRAARDLQISYKSLLYKIKQIGVTERKPEG